MSNATSALTWRPDSRLVLVKYTDQAVLTGEDGDLLVDALTAWVGDSGTPFALLADAAGLRSTNGDYRRRVGDYFKKHHEAHLALINMGPVIRVIVDLFRVGTGVPLRAFATEAQVRDWLRSVGFSA